MTTTTLDGGPADTAPMTARVRVTGLGAFHAPALAYACGPYKLSGARLGYSFVTGRPTPRQIVDWVARKYGLTLAEITSASRAYRITHPRQEAMWELRRQTRLSFPQIARVVGLTDHTSAIHGVHAHEKRMAGK